MSHILLVEDDPAVLHRLQATIELGGFTSSHTVSAAEALRRVKAEQFDAILLDLGIPDLSGPHLIEKIRAVSDVPVIVISGGWDEAAIIAALDSGADDFVAKPFVRSELLARIRVVLRCYAALRGEPANAAPILIEPPDNPIIQRPIKHGEMVDRLIRHLRSRRSRLVPSHEIISVVWGADKQRTEKNLRVLMVAARRKLKARGQRFEIINVHGRGYRIAPTAPSPPTVR